MILAICVLGDVSKYLDILTLEFFLKKKSWCIFHFDLGVSGYCVCCLSWTSWKPWCNVHDSCGRHLWCWWSLFSEHCIRTWIILHNVTSEYNSTFVFLKSWFQLRILKMAQIHQWLKMNFSALFPCVFDHLFLVSDFCQVPRRNFLQFSHYFSTATFASGMFNAWGIGINLCTKL